MLGETGWDSVDLILSGVGLVAGSCEHGNEPLGFVKGMEFLD
jgi:hypothetical protein